MIMAVNSVNAGSNYVSQVQPQPQKPAERAVEKENDKDRDDAAKIAALNKPVQPTVNTQGDTVGRVINTKA
jgi:hypothetical protein